MFGNVKLERAALEATYDSVCDIYRTEKKKGADRISRAAEVLLYEKVPCAVSNGSDGSAVSGGKQTLSLSRVLFISPEYKLRAGDVVKAIVQGETQEYYVSGVPVRYATHTEVYLEARGLA